MEKSVHDEIDLSKMMERANVAYSVHSADWESMKARRKRMIALLSGLIPRQFESQVSETVLATAIHISDLIIPHMDALIEKDADFSEDVITKSVFVIALRKEFPDFSLSIFLNTFPSFSVKLDTIVAVETAIFTNILAFENISAPPLFLGYFTRMLPALTKKECQYAAKLLRLILEDLKVVKKHLPSTTAAAVLVYGFGISSAFFSSSYVNQRDLLFMVSMLRKRNF